MSAEPIKTEICDEHDEHEHESSQLTNIYCLNANKKINKYVECCYRCDICLRRMKTNNYDQTKKCNCSVCKAFINMMLEQNSKFYDTDSDVSDSDEEENITKI